MKTCSYCGKENGDDQFYCAGCGTELNAEPVLVIAKTEPAKPVRLRTPQMRPGQRLMSAGFFENAPPLDFSVIDMGYETVEGFSRPNWKSIGAEIRKTFPEEQWGQAWRLAGVEWLQQLSIDLGGNYVLHESQNFLLLSAESEKNCTTLLNLAESTIAAIDAQLKSLPSEQKLYGKRVILAFEEQDDYYAYISYYYTEGTHSTSGGVFLGKGYRHVALPLTDMKYARQVIAHELVHVCVSDFSLPAWLNEGLAQRLEAESTWNNSGSIYQLRRTVLDDDLVEDHHAHWNEKNIQEFWAGTSFWAPDGENKLSYNFGEILVELVADNWDDFLNFVSHADRADAGQDAALKCLHRCLGETAAIFLGPGNWRPNRKAIADIWATASKK